MHKNKNKRDNLFILTNVINVSEQHPRDFSRRSDILDNANASNTIAFKSYDLKRLNKKIFYYSFLARARAYVHICVYEQKKKKLFIHNVQNDDLLLKYFKIL